MNPVRPSARLRRTVSACALATLAAGAFAGSAAAAPQAVTPSNAASLGWSLSHNNNGSAAYSLAPGGAGSTGSAALKFKTGAGTAGPAANGPDADGRGGEGAVSLDTLVGKKLTDITSLEYSALVKAAADSDQVAPSLRIPVSFSGSSTNPDTVLVFEPTYAVGGAITKNVWHSYDALTQAGWWAFNPSNAANSCQPVAAPGANQCPTTLQTFTALATQLGAQNPDGEITVTATEGNGEPIKGGLNIVTGMPYYGFPWRGVEAFVDNVKVGINNVDKTYDFGFEAPTNEVVRPSNLNGWALEARNTATASIASSVAPQLNGASALHLTTGSGAPATPLPYGNGGKAIASLPATGGEYLSDLTSLQFTENVRAAAATTTTASLQIPLTASASGDWDLTVIYEPGEQTGGPAAIGTTRTYDTLAPGAFWWAFSRTQGRIDPPHNASSLSELFSLLNVDYDDARVLTNTTSVEGSGQPVLPGVQMQLGQRSSSPTSNNAVADIDDVVVAFAGAGKSYNFVQDLPVLVADESVMVVGGTAVDANLLCDLGEWTGTGNTYTRQWYTGENASTAIAGATKKVFRVTAAELGQKVTCKVTAANDGGSTVESDFIRIPTAPTNGTNGTNGTDGAPGTNGTNGTDGAPGTNGTNGTNGTDGAPGTNGTNGTDGAPGTNGTNGTDGAPGTNGTNGTDGAPGTNGTNGAPGTNGTNGTDGATGPQGPIGLTGQNGTNGTNGTTGPQGPIGLTGQNGATGLTGSIGATGATGATGPAGPAAQVNLSGTTTTARATVKATLVKGGKSIKITVTQAGVTTSRAITARLQGTKKLVKGSVKGSKTLTIKSAKTLTKTTKVVVVIGGRQVVVSVAASKTIVL